MHMYSTLRRAAVALIAVAALLVGAAPAWGSYGFSSFEVNMNNQGGTPDTQAGSHPYEVTTAFELNTVEFEGKTVPAESQRDLTVNMPVGFVGNPTAVPSCPRGQLAEGKCPVASQVGVNKLEFGERMFVYSSMTVGVYNMAPSPGRAAEFGFLVDGVPVYLRVGVRSESDYGVSVKLVNEPSTLAIKGTRLTLWGDPAASSHDAERGPQYECVVLPFVALPCTGGEHSVPQDSGPFLTMPTTCGTPLLTTASSDSWQHPGTYVTASSTAPALTGCEGYAFNPSVSVTPTNAAAGSPTGLNVAVTVPQDESPGQRATPAIKNMTINMPEGLVISPSGASGRAACSDQQLGIGTTRSAECPSASRVGTFKIDSPVLEEQLEGGVFIGAQKPGDPYRLFLVAEAPERGVLVRLIAHVTADPHTGRLTVRVAEAPQLPASRIDVELEGGARALLHNPTSCGTATTTAQVTPWASSEASAVAAASSYVVGGQCGARPFAPRLSAGSSEPQAAGSSPFTFTLIRQEGEQQLGSVTVDLPPGLMGKIGSVAQCPSASASAGSCPAASEIGTVAVAAGAGEDPLWVQGGHVYLTGPYEGAPFGLAFVVPAIAGPFDLGNVVVRGAINVDPRTAQVSVRTDPLPLILEGVPLELRRIAVSIDRSQFMVNPTSCAGSAVNAVIGSASGTVSDATERYNVANCASLPFKPEFSALTHASHTRAGGEYLHVVLKSGPGQANIGKVHVQLPGSLPSRLSTLKLACTEAQFAANPAGCPADAIVGEAVVRTPVLPVPIAGPAIFVSHAGKGFPNLDLVLQGDGVHITLVGDTFINKKQITTSTFPSVPDVPISRFDLILPAGPHSALGGNGNMCAKPLYMPTAITGQNGAVVSHRTRIMVQGCSPAIHVLGHKVTRGRAHVHVRVPSAGKLVVNGHGIGREVKRVRKAKIVTIGVRLSRRYRRAAAKHHLKIRVKVKLRFKPNHGRTLHAHARVLLR